MGTEWAIWSRITRRQQATRRDQGRHGTIRTHAEVSGHQGTERSEPREGRRAGNLPRHKVGVWRQNDAQMDDLENGFDAKAVKYFFANWNASDEEKMRLRDWMAPIINNEILSFEVLQGYTIKRASPFVGEAEACEL